MKKIIFCAVWLLIVLGLLTTGHWSSQVSAAPGTDFYAYLPLVLKNFPRQPTIFGVEINRGAVNSTITHATNARVTWVRYNGVQWEQIEATPGVYNWSSLDQVKADILTMRQNGLEPQIVVRGAPSWAQKFPGVICGAIKEDALDDYAAFLAALVNQLSGAPYRIKYWEMGNEPDVQPVGFDPTLPYGCWGDQNDPYYGGEYYATMLSYAYPAMKQADPQAKVILGGLLLICDPTNPPPNNPDNCLPGKFLEGILRNQGGQYVDIIAYHSYPYWYSDIAGLDWDLEMSFWKHRGGILLGKLDFVRTVMAQYGVNKPILMNEGGLVCGWDEYRHPNEYPRCLTPEFQSTQANYVPRLYARSWAGGLMSSMWYTLNGGGWRECGLLDDDQAPRPAYNAYAYLAGLLEGASYSGQLSNGTLEGYQFTNTAARRTYQIYWSNNTSTFDLPKPAGTLGVYDHFGNDITPAGDTLTIPFDPVTIIVIAQP